MKSWMLLFFVLLFSCTHKPQYLHVQPTQPKAVLCDSINITYHNDIKPIFRDNCYHCHSTSGTSGGGLNLEDTTSLKNYLNYGFRGDGLYGSKLYHCLLHSQLAQPMPPTFILDSCSLHKIHYWLVAGAPI